jgi:hypothetical protein
LYDYSQIALNGPSFLEVILTIILIIYTIKAYLNKQKNTISCRNDISNSLNGCILLPSAGEDIYIRFRDLLATFDIIVKPIYLILHCYKEGESNYNDVKIKVILKMNKRTPWYVEGIHGVKKSWEIPVGRISNDIDVCIANIGAVHNGHVKWKIQAVRGDNNKKIIKKGKYRFDNRKKLNPVKVYQLDCLYYTS